MHNASALRHSTPILFRCRAHMAQGASATKIQQRGAACSQPTIQQIFTAHPAQHPSTPFCHAGCTAQGMLAVKPLKQLRRLPWATMLKRVACLAWSWAGVA